MSLEVGLRVLVELEQGRDETRLEEVKYDAVGPDNRLVASESEERWKEKLERVTHLEQAYGQAQQEANDNFLVISIALSRRRLLPFSSHTKTSWVRLIARYTLNGALNESSKLILWLNDFK